MSSKDTVLRFTVNERIQHFLLIIAFIILFLSGFSLKYNETEAGALLIRILGGMENRSLIHRIGAILLIVTGMYHVLYIFFTGRGRSQGSAVLLRKKDFKRMGTVLGSLFSNTGWSCWVQSQWPYPVCSSGSTTRRFRCFQNGSGIFSSLSIARRPCWCSW